MYITQTPIALRFSVLLFNIVTSSKHKCVKLCDDNMNFKKRIQSVYFDKVIKKNYPMLLLLGLIIAYLVCRIECQGLHNDASEHYSLSSTSTRV